MENPYAPPQANLEKDVLVLRKKTGWKIVFWCYLFIEVVGVASMLFGGDEPVLDLVGEIVVYSLAFIGIFAFAYNKKIATPQLWRMVMLLLLMWDCYIFLSGYVDGSYDGLELSALLIIGSIVVPMLFLQYFALYQYAFQSKEIWNKP